MNQGILSSNNNFIFPQSSNDSSILIGSESFPRTVAREGISKIGQIEFYPSNIPGLNLGFSSFNSISGNNREFLNPSMTSSVGVVRENLEGGSQIRYSGVIPGGSSGLCYEYFSNNYTPLSIMNYLTNNNYNWNPDKLCIVIDTTKNLEGLYFRTVPIASVDFSATITIDWGDNSPIDSGFCSASTSFPHLYKKHGVYIIQITSNGNYFLAGNPLGGGLLSGKSINSSIIGILSFGNPPYIDGYKSIFTFAAGDSSPNMLFFPNKLPKNINSKTSPIDVYGLSNNIEVLTSLFANRRFVPLFFPSAIDKLDYSNCESWDTSDIKYFINTFNSSSIRETNLSRWNTSKVISFQGMFDGSRMYKGNGIENWDTSNATIFTNMFQACANFNNSLANWNVSSGIDMSNMFNNCNIFIGSGLENWNVGKVTSMNNMFSNCNNLNTNLNNWNTSSVTNMNNMFNGCSVFNSNLSGWNTSNVTLMSTMFQSCANFRGSGLENWNTSNVTSFSTMFNNCVNFNANLSGWNITKTTNLDSMFRICSSFRGSGLENWNTINITSLNNTFQNCSNLNVNLSGWNTSNVTNMAFMFQGCTNFRGSGLENWNVSNVTNIANMFSFCSNFNTNLSGWNISKIANFNELFRGCSNFLGSGLENWNVSNVTNFINAFSSCDRLGSGFNLDLSNWNVSSGTNFTSMFEGCTNFRGGGLANWNVSNATNTIQMFRSCTLFDANLSGWNVSKISNLNSMFHGCSNFRGSGLENWNVSNNTIFTLMFFYNTNFNTNLSGWNVSSGTNFTSMFEGCVNFRGSGLENWNLARINAANGLDNFLANTTGISTSQYDLILNSWNNNKTSGVNGIANWRTDLRPHFGSSKYTAAGSGARASLISYGWTITDGGLQT